MGNLAQSLMVIGLFLWDSYESVGQVFLCVQGRSCWVVTIGLIARKRHVSDALFVRGYSYDLLLGIRTIAR